MKWMHCFGTTNLCNAMEVDNLGIKINKKTYLWDIFPSSKSQIFPDHVSDFCPVLTANNQRLCIIAEFVEKTKNQKNSSQLINKRILVYLFPSSTVEILRSNITCKLCQFTQGDRLRKTVFLFWSSCAEVILSKHFDGDQKETTDNVHSSKLTL